MATTVQLNLSAGTVPTGTQVDLNGLVQLVVSLIQADVEGSFLTGQIGGAEPTSNVGLWVKNGTSLWAWDATTLKYVQVSLPLIYSPLTLNVVSDGTQDNATSFATVQGAHDSLLKSQILPGVVVTIKVAAGTYNSETSLQINHPQSNQIVIQGAAPIVLNVNGNAILAYNSGVPTLSFAVDDGTKLAVGQTGFLQNDSRLYLDGAVVVKTLTGNNVTATFVSALTTLTIGDPTRLANATLTVFPTVFTTTTPGLIGVRLIGNGLRSFSNALVLGVGTSATGNGFSVEGQGTFKFNNMACAGWAIGLVAQSPAVSIVANGSNYFCNHVFYGIQLFNGSQLDPANGILYLSGNGWYGLYLYGASIYSALNNSALLACRNGVAGVAVGAASVFNASVPGGVNNTTYCLVNNRQGMVADARSAVIMQGTEVHNVSGNGLIDFQATASSSILVAHAGTVHTSNPANNAATADGSFISVGT